jgi:hypothetical protein
MPKQGGRMTGREQMTPREHAEELRQQAIKTLLAEKRAIEEQLKLLGYGKENAVNGKRRGRPPNSPW